MYEACTKLFPLDDEPMMLVALGMVALPVPLIYRVFVSESTLHWEVSPQDPLVAGIFCAA